MAVIEGNGIDEPCVGMIVTHTHGLRVSSISDEDGSNHGAADTFVPVDLDYDLALTSSLLGTLTVKSSKNKDVVREPTKHRVNVDLNKV